MILYQMSRAYALEGESEKSVAALDRIASEYPDSQYMDEFQFRRGENLFVAREYAAAEQAYGAVVRDYPDRQLRRANTKRSLKILGELMPFRFARVESNDVYVDIQ